MDKTISMIAQTPYHDRLKGLRGAFNDRPANTSDDGGALILLLAAVVIIVLWIILQRSNDSRGIKSKTGRAGKIYVNLLSQLGFSRIERMILKMFARESQLANPAIIFFDEDAFERHTSNWLDGISLQIYRRRASAIIDQLRDRLFPDIKDSDEGHF